ncbi:MAG TPA: SDR family NAD(P)-dependent oxidoreductase [Gemmatimonadales bacterium]|nr:SDR family NAD(P)-dependent oxidoreductase [Gemmatimonadales bacterium]
MSSGSPSSVAFVTGATGGIGRATAVALGRAGYRVGVCARTAGRLERLLAELRAEGIAAAGLPADVADESAVRAAVRHAAEALGPIDLLVNNAGTAILRPFEELTPADWDATMATNLRGLFLVTREVLPGMRQRRRGTIVNVASLAGKHGFAGGTAYAASKHAVLGFSRSLMLEVRKQGIRVVALCPGSVDTALLRDPGNRAVLKPNLDRVLRPEDVAQAILDLVRLPDRVMVSEIELRPTDP